MINQTTFTALFAITVLLLGTTAGPLGLMQSADALQGQGVPTSKYGSATKGKVCGDKLCSEVRTEKAKEENKKKEQVKTEKKTEEVKKAEQVPPKDKKAETMTKAKQQAEMIPSKTITKTITSVQDPGVGHEGHQLAIILPPSKNVYRGHLVYDASEPIQLIALHGPLDPGKDKGQAIWSPDGKKKYALTFVDNKKSAGVWQFTGNAVAVHTKNSEPFTVTYSVTYKELPVGDNVVRGTVTSTQDPGMGHEGHQLAVIMPPREKPYVGHLTYDASENIQLVALIGPLQGDQVKGQATWTVDGEKRYALVLIDPMKSAGSWQFQGNAIAFHTTNTNPFTVTYTAVWNN